MRSERFLGASTTFFDITKYLLLTIVVIAALFMLVGVPLFVEGVSMKPNFSTGEVVIIERLSYLGDKPVKRGDVVAATFPGDPKRTRLIKRIIGLPNETVTLKDGAFSIDGQPLAEIYQISPGTPPYQELETVVLKSDEYFLAGDNRPGSSDSRLWGPVARGDIQGRASFVLWPLGSVRYVDRY